MTDVIYRIVHRPDDSFVVEIARPGALGQMADGFASEAEASSWIAQDKRLSGARDTSQAPGRRRWRSV
jgi:hypothetical protein